MVGGRQSRQENLDSFGVGGHVHWISLGKVTQDIMMTELEEAGHIVAAIGKAEGCGGRMGEERWCSFLFLYTMEPQPSAGATNIQGGSCHLN